MKHKKRVILMMLVSLIFIIGCAEKIEKVAEERISVSPTTFSGTIERDQVWSGNISVTGDVTVEEGVTLTILPGTIVTVTAFSDDQHGGVDHPHDPPFPKDPDRIETSSTVIQINGFLNASGTPDNKIIFTTDKKQTTYDWDGLGIAHGRLDYALVEYARYNNIQQSSDVIISNSIIRNSLECCLCIGHAQPVSPQILNNDIYNCGHEGIDNGGGSAIIRGNYFHVENPKIQPNPGNENGVVIYQNTYPIVENNRFEKLRWALFFLEDSKNEREEGKRAIIRNNIIKNNEVAFNINSGYPMEYVLRENNTMINNTEEEVREG